MANEYLKIDNLDSTQKIMVLKCLIIQLETGRFFIKNGMGEISLTEGKVVANF